MLEKLYTSEASPKTPQLDYAAVPLDPWRATEIGGSRNYEQASCGRIDSKVTEAMDIAVSKGWVKAPELEKTLRKFLTESLYDSLTRRIDLNAMASSNDSIGDSDPRMIRAKAGLAAPAELMTLLIDYPNLHSIEIAMLSHPLNARATEAMDTDVKGVFANLENSTALPLMPRYKMKRIESTIPAGIVLRKQALHNIETAAGTIQIVQRKSFLVRGDKDAGFDVIDRMIEHKERFGELSQKIEGYLPYFNLDPNEYPMLKWLQPTATSYYAKYLDKKE
jgi:hypothetical protein